MGDLQMTAVKEITPDDLKQMLATDAPIAVVDIRESPDYEAWHIPGSTSLPVYDALRSGKAESLLSQTASLPRDRPIVAVCRAGNTSLTAAALLEQSGFDAVSLRGGMRGWSGVWSEAEIELEGRPDVRFIQVRRNGKGCLSYLIGSAGEAVVVDACVDADAYRDIAAREGLKITEVLETHVHADHLSRGRELAEATGAAYRVQHNDRLRQPYEALHDGDRVRVGELELDVVATPGHTGESVCYLVDGQVLLSGDTLFVESVGRPDLEKGDAGAEEGAHALYASLHDRLLGLADSLLVCPAHFGGAIGFDGKAIAAPLGRLCEDLELLKVDENTFVAAILERLPAKPPNHEHIILINEGKRDRGWIDPADLEFGPNRCAVQ